MKKLERIFWGVLLLVFALGIYAIAEEITLTTYYPAPYGVYDQLELPRRDFDTGELRLTASDPSGDPNLKSIWNLHNRGSAAKAIPGGDGDKLYLMFSGNGGATWSGPYVLVDNAGRVGIGLDPINNPTETPQNRLDVEGAVAIGQNYSGTETAPSNGMIIEGLVVIGTADNRSVDAFAYIPSGYDSALKLDVNGIINGSGYAVGGQAGYTAGITTPLVVKKVGGGQYSIYITNGIITDVTSP